jgi:hypothetical protein
MIAFNKDGTRLVSCNESDSENIKIWSTESY